MRLAFVITGVGAACVFTVVSARLTLGLHQSTSLEFATEQRLANIRLTSNGELIDIALADALEPPEIQKPPSVRLVGRGPGRPGGGPQGLRQLLLDSFREDFGLGGAGGAGGVQDAISKGAPQFEPAAADLPAGFNPPPFPAGSTGSGPPFTGTTPNPPNPLEPPDPLTPPSDPGPSFPPPPVVDPPPVSPPDLVAPVAPFQLSFRFTPPGAPPPRGQSSAAPEPSTWIVLSLGMGAVGAMLRRRRGGASGRSRGRLALADRRPSPGHAGGF